MSDTAWGERRVGETSVTVDLPEGTAVLLDVDVPDWVRLPAELGGTSVRVLGATKVPCPCGSSHFSKVYVLDEPTGIQVAECRDRGFLWFRRG
jgi:hypothetical protein